MTSSIAKRLPLRNHEPEAILLGKLIDNLEPRIGAQLPTNGDVLRFFMFLNRGPMINNKKEDVIKTVIDKVSIFWDISGIPISQYRAGHTKSKLFKMISNYENIRKNKNKANFSSQSQDFINKLPLLFDIAHSNAVGIIQKDDFRTKEMKEEDISFLTDQRSERRMMLGSLDRQYTKKYQRKLSRNESEAQRIQKEETRKNKSNDMNIYISPNEDDDCSKIDSNYEGKEDVQFSVRKRKHESVQLTIPRNPFKSQKISGMADRLNLTLGQRTAFMGAILSEGGVSSKDVVLSVKSSMNASKTVRENVAQTIKRDFHPPKHLTLHWDGKLVPDINNENKERLGVLVSGTPGFEEGKLLGVPIITNATGEEQANASYAMAKEWGVENLVRGVVFDTTASNSGKKIGACVKLESHFDKKMLMFACRHHVYERILASVHTKLFGKTTGPNNTEYIKFKNSWGTIDKTAEINTLVFRERWLKSRVSVVTASLKIILSDSVSNNHLPRDDYRECGELMLQLLGENSEKGKRWLKPGAAHHARWMPSVLYPAKMYAFGSQMGYNSTQLKKFERLCKFNALFYVEKWLMANVASDAPVNDFKLWKNLQEYKKYDREVSEAAISALERHLWYLTQELCIFAIFSKKISNEERQQIAKKLISTPKPKKFNPGRPVFPKLNQRTKLVDFVGPESWFLFETLGVETYWLGTPVHEWQSDVQYQEVETFVKHVKVVNDLSERAVKLIQDYSVTITKDEKQRQYLLQVVENERKRIPDFKKSTLI